MADYMRHVGRIRNTDQRCVVVFMQIPNLEDHALVINTESLPPRFEQYLHDVVESAEGQSAQDLGTVMARRLMPDTGRDILYEFHQSGFMRREPVDNVVMLPRPNMPFSLRDVLTKMGRVIPERRTLAEPPSSSIEEIYGIPPTTDETVKYNRYEQNQVAGRTEETTGIAKSMLIDAELLEQEAKRKREHAYEMAPSLRPKNVTAEKPVAKAVAAKETKVKPHNASRKGAGRPPKAAATV